LYTGRVSIGATDESLFRLFPAGFFAPVPAFGAVPVLAIELRTVLGRISTSTRRFWALPSVVRVAGDRALVGVADDGDALAADLVLDQLVADRDRAVAREVPVVRVLGLGLRVDHARVVGVAGDHQLVALAASLFRIVAKRLIASWPSRSGCPSRWRR
jgi:hypothetical protein